MPKPLIEITLSTHPRVEAVFKLTRFCGGELFQKYKTAIDGARFDGTDRTNRSELEKVIPILHRLKAAGLEAFIADDLRKELVAISQRKKALAEKAKKRADLVDEELKKRGLSLYPFQKIGVTTLASRSSFMLLDQPGLGKSVQAITAHPDNAPCLVVCPSVMKQVWLSESRKFRPELRTYLMSGRNGFRWPQPGEIGTINYDILPSSLNQEPVPGMPRRLFETESPENVTVVFDEGHMLKSYKSQRHHRAKMLAEAVRKNGGRSWLLTGTPLLSHPTDLWSLLQVLGLANEAFGSFANFITLFGGFEDEFGGMHWSSAPDPEVAGRLQRVSLRRLKKEVLPELPQKTYRIMQAAIDRETLALADTAWKEIQEAGIDLEKAEEFAKLESDSVKFETVSAARKALATAKIPTLLELLDVFEEAEEPVIVFSRHREPIDMLGKRQGWGVITGSTSDDAFRISELFQNGSLHGIAATIQAGGVGITLTRACNVVFLDRDWTPALNDQAEDRVCRIGQTRGVVITILLADHVMDKHVEKVLRQKGKIIAGSVEASSVAPNHEPTPDYDDSLRQDEIRRRFAEIVKETGEAGGQGNGSQAAPSATPIGTALRLITKARDVGVARAEGQLYTMGITLTSLELDTLEALDVQFERQGRTLTRKQYDLLAFIFQGDVT